MATSNLKDLYPDYFCFMEIERERKEREYSSPSYQKMAMEIRKNIEQGKGIFYQAVKRQTVNQQTFC